MIFKRSTDDVMKAIEDDQVMLSTYKASRFVKPFARDVDKWERDISHILEVTEALLTVQRQWLYLEVRFLEIFLIFSTICFFF
jgi:dynein heavy chain